MPRTEEANQRIRDERREQVLQAAAGVFARKGLADTKIVDIAAAAGISHGLAYRYFTSKEEVFAELVGRSLNGVTRLTEEVLQQPGTPWDKLRWITEQTLAGMRRRPELHWSCCTRLPMKRCPPRCATWQCASPRR